MMRITAALLATYLLSGCMFSRPAAVNVPNVIVTRPNYAIGQQSTTQFLVFATSAAYADDAIKEELNCGKTPCAAEQIGVIYAVERLAK